MSSKSNGKGRSSEATKQQSNSRAQHGDGAMAEEMRCERCKAIGSRGSRWFGEGCLCQFQHGQKRRRCSGRPWSWSEWMLVEKQVWVLGGSGFGVGITRGLLIGGSRALEAVTGERFKEGRGRSQGKWRHRQASRPSNGMEVLMPYAAVCVCTCTCTFGACRSIPR